MKNMVYNPHKSTIGSMDANIMAMLTYLATWAISLIPYIGNVAWLAPLVIFFIEKDSMLVKYHAMQAFVLNLIGKVIGWIIGGIIGAFISVSYASLYTLSTASLGAAAILSGILSLLLGAISILILVVSIIAMIKAYNYVEYHIPLVDKISIWLAGLFKVTF